MKRILKNRSLVILDILIVNVTTLFGFYLRFDWNIPEAYMNFYYSMIIPMSILIYVNNEIFDLYSRVWKYASINELISIVKSVALFTVENFLFGFVVLHKLFGYSIYRMPYSIMLISIVLNIVAIGGLRFLLRIINDMEQNQMTSENVLKNILIIGAGDAGDILIKELKKHPEMGEKPVAIIDDDEQKIGKKINGIPIVGNRSKIQSTIEEYNIKEVIFAIPSASNKDKKELIDLCKEYNVKLKTIPGIYEIVGGRVSISQIRDVNIEDLLGRDEVTLDTNGIDKYIMDKVVLVTGGGGSIGSEICRQVSRFKPKKLIIMDIYENNAYDLQMELNYNFPDLDKRVIIASIRDKDRIKNVFSTMKPDVVFHAAAHKHVPLMEDNPSEVVKNNILGTLNVAECADLYNVKKFVLISTDKAVNPTNIMGASKRVCEMIIQSINSRSATEFVAVRFGNVLGSNGSVIPLFKKQISKGGPITVTHPEITRFFMTIPEAAQLVIQAGAMAMGGEIFILDMGEPVRIVDLAKDLIRLSGFEPGRDIKIQFNGLRPGEKLYEELLMDTEDVDKTTHNKIFIGKNEYIDFDNLVSKINKLKDLSLENKENKIFDFMEELVPTYKRTKD